MESYYFIAGGESNSISNQKGFVDSSLFMSTGKIAVGPTTDLVSFSCSFFFYISFVADVIRSISLNADKIRKEKKTPLSLRQQQEGSKNWHLSSYADKNLVLSKKKNHKISASRNKRGVGGFHLRLSFHSKKERNLVAAKDGAAAGASWPRHRSALRHINRSYSAVTRLFFFILSPRSSLANSRRL